jgi:hypothetical protein
MSEQLRAMSDDELGTALSTLDLAWPPAPDLAPAVMASTRAPGRPRVGGLPMSRSRRIILIAAAIVILLAGAALAARFVIDLGALIVNVTTSPPGRLPTSSPAPPGNPITLQEASVLLGHDASFPTRLGRPDRVWADEVITDAGTVVRITMAWESGTDLPEIAGTRLGAVLIRFEGDVDQASKELFEGTGVLEPVQVDGKDGYWTTGTHLLELLTSEGVVFVRVDGNVVLWNEGSDTMRLETAVPKAEAVRIAASTGTS